MMRPSIAEERAHAITDQLDQWPLSDEERAAMKARFATHWKRHGALAALAFFVLTALAVSAFAAFCELISLTTFFAAAVCITAAELLIRRRRMYGSGIETALWIGGLLSLIFGLPHSGAPEALLVIAAAFAIAAWRMQSAIFGTIGAVFVAAYFADVWHGSHQYWQVAAVPLAMLLAAAIAKRLVIRRPWLEALLSYLVIVMPLVAEICGRIASWSSRGQIEMVIAYGLLGIALIGWGIILRDHAIFISAAVCFGVAAFEAQDLVQIAIEWQLIAGGVVLLAIAGIVARLLRGREAGFVSTPQRLTRYDELLKTAGSLAAGSMLHERPAEAPAGVSGTAQGAGSFGGAGSTGDY